MSIKGKGAAACLLALLAALAPACNRAGDAGHTAVGPAAANSNANTAKANPTPAAKPDADGVISSGTGTEKEKPAAGKANVQGKVFFNEQPAAGVEAKLCEKFNQFFGGCGGETFKATTDAAGEYLIKDVPPRVYEGLIVKVFDSDYYIFATSGIVSTAKYRVEGDQTFFAPDTHLFKSDLKLVSPKAGSKVAPENIELKWDAYPDAAYYKFSVHADSASGAKTEYDYINKRVEGVSYALDKPLTPGSYTCKVEAYNGKDRKLAQSANDIKFTVTGGAAAQ